MKSRWSGPYIVERVSPFGAISVRHPKSGEEFLVNGQRLKLYVSEPYDKHLTVSTFSDK